MGNNLDLVSLLGFPMHIMCSVCNNQIRSYFEDYDIESGTPFINGKFNLHCYCIECDFEFSFKGILKIEEL